MARGSSFGSLVTAIARDQARNERLQVQQARQRQREIEKAQREAVRQRAMADKEAKQRYLEARIQETDDKNKQLLEEIKNLQGILDHTLQIDDTIKFDDLRIKDIFQEFLLPPELQNIPKAPQLAAWLATVKKPSALEKLIPGSEGRYQRALQEMRIKFQENQKKFDAYIAAREAKIKNLRDEYDKEKQDFETKKQERNIEVDEFEAAYKKCDPTAVISYCTMVLERSDYPEGFPQEFRAAYVPESKELVVEYELPTTDIVPKIADYRYTKSKDTIEEKSRKPSEVKEQYEDIVASMCLRTLHELIESDQNDNIHVIAFNGFVQTVDPSTGRDIRPYLISIRTTKERFCELDLSRVDKRACLRNLGAQVSPRPDEMVSVKPIIEFDMVDKRFVEQSDILGDLESRPNLMDLKPFEFENLVSNLFERIGFQAKLTRSSKDGGVDAVAFDPRPILGGKVVIQAKRYRNVVGVSAVRDLYGTMINEGANKGILVTTSHYGPDAYDFSKDKPIELIDGGGLLYLLEQQGISARIIFPEE
jgi:restriction system protein